MGERAEEGLVQQLVPEPAVEALDQGVLLRLARGDVVPLDASVLTPPQDRHAGQLGAVVRDARDRLAAPGDDRIELAPDPQPDRDVSATSPRHSRVKSSTTARMRKRRPSLSWSCRKSSDQRWLGPCGTVSGALVPSARLRPPRRRTCNRSSP